MPTQLLTGEDTRFLAQQPEYEVDVMVGQMTTLIQNITDLQNDTDDKVKTLESQNWFKRMTNTLFGKNKATKQEIQKNNDKVITYISQSVAQLYNMNLINERVICSLGNRMNEVYIQLTELNQEQLNMKAQISQIMAVQQQTMEALGAFVSKLNEKIESVDNFHMLISEIQNGMYNDSSKLYNLCSILSQIDKRQMDDNRKMNLLNDTMQKAGLITSDGITVLQCLQEIVALPQEKIGLIYLELCNFRSSFPANLFADMIESYHFLSKMEKMSKKKEVLIQRVLDKYELDADAEFSIADISESFFENKQACLVKLTSIPQISMQAEASAPQQASSVPQFSAPEAPTATAEYDADKVKELWDNKDYEASLPIVRAAAESGDMNAQGDLGLMYQLGWEVDVDMSAALKWYLKSAEQGNVSSMESVAKIYAGLCKGSKSLKNARKAEEWFKKAEKAATEEDDFDYYNYYDFLQNEGRERDAFAVMKRGAKNGNIFAILDLANAYYWGEDYGVSQDFYEAGKWFEKAADAGDAVAMMRMGEFCLYGRGNVQEDNDEAFRYLTKAVEKDDDLPFAHEMLGKCYLNGWGTNENTHKAKEHLQKAANANSAEAMYWLGILYRNAGNGGEATKWLQKAADNDNIDSLVALGYMYLNGNAVRQNYQRAYEFFKKAANHGDADAQFAVGEMYNEGYHVQQNYSKANEWFRKAMNQGDADAKGWLGINYYCGNGVSQNKNYGAQLINEAEAEGCEFVEGFIEEYEQAYIDGFKEGLAELIPGYKLGKGIVGGINKFLKK